MTRQTQVFLGMEAVIASEPMRLLMRTVERVARAHASVLITGESGCGKELIARALHHYSLRAHKPWVDLSCAALPEHLLESELFGYEKGAFSGADSTKPGLFEMAHNGTIFLDEIGELDPRMQVKLLRVLDAVSYYRLGGVKKVSVDVRVVAATNQDLEAAVRAGRFRSDLYHRLAQFTLQVPPLRQRVQDIAPLARHFLAQHDPSLQFSPSALALLERRPWPGNIRELRNVVTKAAVLTQSQEISAGELSLTVSSELAMELATCPAVMSNAASNNLEAMEKRAIMDALAATDGHQQNAAARLGISRRTLTRKLKLYRPERRHRMSPSRPILEPGAEKRREIRRPGKGNVRVQWSNPSAQEVEGRLVDVSASGFRMAHACSALAAGQCVEFAHPEAKGRARVVWTRIVPGAVESGFVVATDDV